MLVTQFIERQREERKGAARPEVSPDDRDRLAGIQNEEALVRTANEAVEAIARAIAEIDHQFHRARRQHALAVV